MTDHWIDEAEKRQEALGKQKEKEEITIQHNLEENCKFFHAFIEDLNKLLQRVNNLSFEERKPSLELGFTEVEEKKCYEFYGSAYIYRKTIFMIFTGTRYKQLCWRRINFKISDQLNIVKVHISEKYTEKNKGVTHTRAETKDKFKLRINGFDEALLGLSIDWLTYKCTSHDFKKLLPFAHPSNGNHKKK